MGREPWGWGIQDIRQLVRHRVPESSSLDYKSGRLFENPDKAANDVSVHVSAFANGAGGTVVYGVREEDRVPIEIDGVDPQRVSQEWLDQVLSSKIQPKIADVRIRVIRVPRKPRVVFVVWTPQSDRAPHQASDLRFHIRRNARTEPMEEYELRDVWQRRRAPDILLSFYFRRLGQHVDRFLVSWANPATEHQLEVNADIWNEGGGEVRQALIEVAVDSRLVWPRPQYSAFPMKPLTLTVGDRSVPVHFLQTVWSGPSGMPLFKSVKYRLFRTDFPIRFTKAWVESETPPFLLWSVRAPEMLEKTGYVEVAKEKEDMVLVPKAAPVVGGYQRDVFRRPFMTSPDIAFGEAEADSS